ncbi:glutaminyl-tRNA synthetase [Oceanospirillum multiglobuliferum]|uniref:Glutamine--tRNA ligase n=1 Tax=Oceanospirillum multiglobuliferum TaxID=64969 RepID=A0A1T4P3I1_9GAMM|nr:glutamine--tRNA ligase/YqeY domain fusion protein [Oceanospirillum multiglobuliferum]OPX54829.1 glutamine--tRNA ligase [Oceanospirillum multiglobuliferum]SJZ86095.1 glutaminyl-tRNA synthetase [Oceanospirillum multiglobuliferum]
MSNTEATVAPNFIRNLIKEELAEGQVQQVITRFPPEPNGYLHIGHAKSICLNFGLAEYFNGECNLRFDDTNPEKESQEYIDSIQEDVRWLGFEWSGKVRYTSEYFDQLFDYAVELIKAGKAYVCELNAEQMREYRGTLTEAGKNSPFRDRSVEENLDQFNRMRAGEFADGTKVLRAKIDMSAPNINLRDPILYRIRSVPHHQTGDKWCIYPSYDFAHGQSDALEGITHSVCTLEFEDHRPLYNWFIDNLPVPAKPKQIEFSRLNLNYTVTSKRKLKQLVDEGFVSGWDDPRMPTISGMRRRGYTPASLRHFCDLVGVTRSDGVVDVGMLYHALRADLEQNAPRAMCVLDPIKVTITNYPDDQVEEYVVPSHPADESMGERVIPFSKNLLIEAEDFMEDAPKKFFRLTNGGEVRLRNSYVIKCEEVIKDANGKIIELLCTYDADTLGKNPEGRKVKGVIHWVSEPHAVPAEVRLYENLFTDPNPDSNKEVNFLAHINPESLAVTTGYCEPSLLTAAPETVFQFERIGYFCADRYDHGVDGKLVFNKTVGLKDSWAKIQNKG